MSVVSKPAVTLIGGILVLAGAVMLVTPGPGLLVIAAGLAVWAREYDWAKGMLRRARERIEAARARVVNKPEKQGAPDKGQKPPAGN